MRIVHVGDNFGRPDAGVSRAAVSMAEELQRQGHDIRLVDEDGTAGLRGWMPGRHPRALGARLDKAMLGADAVHCHGLWLRNGIEARLQAERLRVPRIVSVHGMLAPWALRHRAWRKRLAWKLYERENLRTACCLHATSSQEARHIREIGLCNPVAVVPLGIDTSPYITPLETELVLRLRDRLGGKRILLFLSRLHAVKGVDVLLSVWRQLVIDFPEWHLVLAGPDQDGFKARLVSQIRSAGLGNRVTFVGPVYGPDKYALLRAAELFVLPSHTENFGLVVLEALAAAVPVITTTGTPWEDLARYECGWWVGQDAEALLEGMGEALRSPTEELVERGLRGRRLVQSAYSWARIATQLADMYEWLGSDRSRLPGFVDLR